MMSVRIKISYETEQELKKVLDLLAPAVREWGKVENKSGRYYRAYVALDDKKIKKALHANTYLL